LSEQPELGQICFGNPTGSYGTKEWQDALIESILEKVGIIYWNRYQQRWPRWYDPNIKGMTFRPYYWGDKEEEKGKPNLVFDFSPQEVRWYKHPGRGQTISLQMSNDEFINWYETAMSLLDETMENDERLSDYNIRS